MYQFCVQSPSIFQCCTISPTRVFCKFSAILFVQLPFALRSNSPCPSPKSWRLSLYLSLQKLAKFCNNYIQQRHLTDTHLQTHRHIESFTMSRPLCLSLRKIDFLDLLVLPTFTFLNFQSISDFKIYYISIFRFIISSFGFLLSFDALQK